MFPTTTKEKLKERIKELECMYEISTIVNQKYDEVDRIFEKVVVTLKKAWRFPYDAIVELKIEDKLFLTDPIPEKTVFQYTKIITYTQEMGYIKVHYPSPQFNQENFLQEELILLFTITNEINAFYEKHLSREREALLKKNAARVDRLTILAEITAGIAHELNTPLGNILGYSELILQNKLEEQTKQDLLKITNAAIYSREIVKKLMFFSCEMPYSMEVLEIKPILTQVISFLEPKFIKQGVLHELDFENTKLKAQLDNIQFTQVLFNILLNSLYVSPKGSTIKIAVTNDETDFFIKIADEGSGISDALKTIVFDPFYTTKPLGDGTGLGLSVVHGIIKSHKGDISISDNKPNGAIFTIKLPLYLK